MNANAVDVPCSMNITQNLKKGVQIVRETKINTLLPPIFSSAHCHYLPLWPSMEAEVVDHPESLGGCWQTLRNEALDPDLGRSSHAVSPE